MFSSIPSSDIVRLTRQVTTVQGQADLLWEQNSEMRHRLGMGPNDSVDLQEMRERREQEERRLKEQNVALSLEVERLKEEKIALRKKIVDQALALSAAADNKPSSSVSAQQQQGPSEVSELRQRVSELKDLLHSEQQRKEACQKEIVRLSKELHSSCEGSRQHTATVKQYRTDEPDGLEEEEKRGLVLQLAEVKAQNAELHTRLNSMEQQRRTMTKNLEHKTTENESLQKQLQALHSSSSTTTTPQHIKEASIASTPLHIASTATSMPLHLLLHIPGDALLLLHQK